VNVLEAIKSRRSVPRLRPEPVPREIVEQMLEAAVWAPNHRMTEPWRFYVLTGDAKRRLAEIRRRVRAAGMPNPEAPEAVKALDRLVEDTAATPVLIAVTTAVPPDPVQREEDLAATYMAVQNLMLAGTALGVGTYLRTGAVLTDPALREMLGLEDDRRIVGIVYVGYPADVPQKRRTRAAERTVWL
jgi:nitroreductase